MRILITALLANRRCRAHETFDRGIFGQSRLSHVASIPYLHNTIRYDARDIVHPLLKAEIFALDQFKGQHADLKRADAHAALVPSRANVAMR